ncbi:MAG: nuclear transport factor 2 family protein [Pseudonocardiales bacterium]
MTPDFVELETSILQAVVRRRWDDLADLLVEDFVITTAGWLHAPATKQIWMAEVAAHHLVHKFEIHSVDVRDMGSVAVALVSSTQWATWQDAPFEGDFRYTDVWRCDDTDRWRLAVRHASLVPPR